MNSKTSPNRSPERYLRRGFCQYLALLAQPPILTAQPPQLLALQRRQTVIAPALVAIGLGHPVANRLCRRFKLPSELFRVTPGSNQLYHLPAKSRRIGTTSLTHRVHLLLKGLRVHEIGSTPFAGKPNRFRAKEYGIWRLFALDQSIKRWLEVL
jgi:hypothetical protein